MPELKALEVRHFHDFTRRCAHTARQPTEAPVAPEAEKPAEEKTSRKWTPSYSVTSQGSATTALEEQLTFPTTEVAADAPAITKYAPAICPLTLVYSSQCRRPSLSLAAVNEHEQSQTLTDGAVGAAPSSAQRARLESTASSRFFPGGWFSGNPKSPEENRTSLEHASGEFLRSENHSGSPAYDVPVNTPVDGVPTRSKRWCLIM